MRLKTTINKQGQIYIPSKVQAEIGLVPKTETEIEYIANRKTILILPPNLTPQQALRSIDIIRQDLEDEVKEQENKVTKEEKKC